MSVVRSAWDFINQLGINPNRLGSIKNYSGAALAGLIKIHGEHRIPEGLICGRTFKVQHKKVILLDTVFKYPFEMTNFHARYIK